MQTFTRLICNRNWLGGWLLPQKHSYFVSVLPHNWWVFGLDYSLVNDIDTTQFEYFAKIINRYFNNRLRKERVIIITHLPDWILNNHEKTTYGKNLHYLMKYIIGKDRVRLRLSGDIHNYTRHEVSITDDFDNGDNLNNYHTNNSTSSYYQSKNNTPNLNSTKYNKYKRRNGKNSRTKFKDDSFLADIAKESKRKKHLKSKRSIKKPNKLNETWKEAKILTNQKKNGAQANISPNINAMDGMESCGSGSDNNTKQFDSKPIETPLVRDSIAEEGYNEDISDNINNEDLGNEETISSGDETNEQRGGLRMNVFKKIRRVYRQKYLKHRRKTRLHKSKLNRKNSNSNNIGNKKNSRKHQNKSSYWINRGATLVVSGGGGAFMHPTHVPAKHSISHLDSIYERVKEFPSIRKSYQYSILNVFGFRKRNFSFDLMGALLYYLLVFSLFPLCNLNLGSDKPEWNINSMFYKFINIFLLATFEIFENSYISITAFFLGFGICFFVIDGYIGFKKRFFSGLMHFVCHYIASVSIVVMMEMVIEAALENKLIGVSSTFDTFIVYFPKTFNFLQMIDENSLFFNGYLLSFLRGLFNVIDITGFHVSLRKTMCETKYKQIQFLFQKLEYPMALGMFCIFVLILFVSVQFKLTYTI